MNSTQIINIVLVVAVLGLIAWGISLIKLSPPAASQGSEHVLEGEMIGEGVYRYGENEPYYTIEAWYPAQTSLSGAADVKARMTIEQLLKDRIEQFKQNGDFANLMPEDVEIQGLGEDRKYALGMEFKEYTSAQYDSFLYAIYEDTLGAHPNGYFLTFVFDQNGDIVTIEDILANNPNGLEELSLLVSSSVTAQLKARAGMDDVTSSIFAEGLAPKAENFQNFVIDGSDLLIAIPPYQVAAYAVGSFEVRIPLSSIQQ